MCETKPICQEQAPGRRQVRALCETKPIEAGGEGLRIADCGVRIEGWRNKANLVCGACPRNKANPGGSTGGSPGISCKTNPIRREAGVRNKANCHRQTEPEPGLGLIGGYAIWRNKANCGSFGFYAIATAWGL